MPNDQPGGDPFADIPDSACVTNRVFDEIVIGERASTVRMVTQEDIQLFAVVSGDVNPAHLDPAYAATDMFHHIIAHGMLGGALISSVLGMKLPGPGTIYLGQDLRFKRPVAIGDTITASVTVREKRADKPIVVLDCLCTNQNGDTVITGTAEVMAPTQKIRRPRMELPDVRLSRHQRYRDILLCATGGAPVPTAIVHPCDANSISAALEAARLGLIVPILVGPGAKIRAAASGMDISQLRLVDTPHSHAAAAAAVALVRAGEAAMLMKGSLHTDELVAEVVNTEHGLRTDRRISHAYLMDVPTYPRPLILTDAAINISPSLADKRDIVQNAIDLAHVMGVPAPRVAILSAVETVTAKLPSTLDAASLCKMAERGQITGGVLDGPLAFDNAVSLQAAHDKKITSEVAGLADILVVPDLEAGNMLAKQLVFLAGADAAGVVLGARVPIILTSRADGARTRIASCAVACLIARAGGAKSAAGA
jgi:phosphotransacetylase/acyl dehydratase